MSFLTLQDHTGVATLAATEGNIFKKQFTVHTPLPSSTCRKRKSILLKFLKTGKNIKDGFVSLSLCTDYSCHFCRADFVKRKF